MCRNVFSNLTGPNGGVVLIEIILIPEVSQGMSPSSARGNQLALSSTTIPLKSSSTETSLPSRGASPNSSTTSLRIAQCWTEIPRDSLAAVSTLDTPPPGNAQYPGKDGIDSLRLPSRTSTPFSPCRVIIRVAVGRGGLRSIFGILRPLGTSLMGGANTQMVSRHNMVWPQHGHN